MLRDKHDKWLSAYEDPEYYERLYRNNESHLNSGLIDEIVMRVKGGLPENVDIGSLDIISTMSIGTSFGYVFEGALHFDLMGFGEGGLAELPSLLAHEIHHLMMWKYVSEFMGSFTEEERYIFTFTGEGLALKFCNNAKGAISRPLYLGHKVNEGLDGFSMDYLNYRFTEALKVFDETLSKIRSGEMDGEDIRRQMEEYWWNPYAEGQSREEVPKLAHSLIYSFGNDLYGSIYDEFGKEVLFDCVRHPLKTIEYFDRVRAKL